MKFKIIVIFILVIILAGCGFQLRGRQALPPEIHTLYLKSSDPYGEFTLRVRKALLAMHLHLTDSNDAPMTLQIISTNLSSIASSVGTSSQSTVYTVTYKAVISISKENKVLIPATTLQSASTMILTAQTALSSTNQLQLTSAQLENDVMSQLFALLSSPQLKNALEMQSSPPSHPKKTKTLKPKSHENHH